MITCIPNLSGQLLCVAIYNRKKGNVSCSFLDCISFYFPLPFLKNVDCEQFKLFQNLCRKQIDNGKECEREHEYDSVL